MKARINKKIFEEQIFCKTRNILNSIQSSLFSHALLQRGNLSRFEAQMYLGLASTGHMIHSNMGETCLHPVDHSHTDSKYKY